MKKLAKKQRKKTYLTIAKKFASDKLMIYDYYKPYAYVCLHLLTFILTKKEYEDTPAEKCQTILHETFPEFHLFEPEYIAPWRPWFDIDNEARIFALLLCYEMTKD